MVAGDAKLIVERVRIDFKVKNERSKYYRNKV